MFTYLQVLGVPVPSNIPRIDTRDPSAYTNSYGGLNRWVRENKVTIATTVLQALL